MFKKRIKMDEYTLKDVYNIADKDMIDLMSAIFPINQIPQWFYRSNIALNNQSPAILCFEGRDAELRDNLIKHGLDKLAWKYQFEKSNKYFTK